MTQEDLGITTGLDATVYLEGHGVPGTLGKPAAQIRRRFDPRLFADAFWISDTSRDVDLHVGFRSSVAISRGGTYRLLVQAASNFRVWLDGDVLVSGPLRYAPAVPEYHWQDIELSEGVHEIAVHAVLEGIMTRTTAPVPGFVFFQLIDGDEQIHLQWYGRELTHYLATGLRASPLLGWMEWTVDPREALWRTESMNARWVQVIRADQAIAMLGTPTPSDAPLPAWPTFTPREISRGTFRETFTGYALDDPAMQFVLADDHPSDDADGIWIRYDLGRIRIGSFELRVRSTSAGYVTIAYCDRLGPDGRPSPVVALSLGPTRMLQHFAIAPGVTDIEPLQSLGGQWIEVRVHSAAIAEVEVEEVVFRERDYLGEPSGSFASPSAVLNRIWQVGVDTTRGAAEDAIVDSVRERGEWLGDVISSVLRIIDSGWGNPSLARRALLHSVATARADGMVAGCGPGGLLYLGTYAAQFFEGCLHVARSEGDLSILEELESNGAANIETLVSLVAEDGSNSLPWGFVDWGYSTDSLSTDVAVTAHVLLAVQHWITWQELLHPSIDLRRWISEETRLSHLVRNGLERSESKYHAYTLAATAGVVDAKAAISHIVDRLETGFPINETAPRLRDPTTPVRTAVTPYFTNYSFPHLLDEGLGELVRKYWSIAWGWMLERGATTWWEVFDDRWSRAHAWSGAPTWQLTQYVLGLRPVLTQGGTQWALRVNTLGLPWAKGTVPMGRGEVAKIKWSASPAGLEYSIGIERPIVLSVRGAETRVEPGWHHFQLHHVVGDLYG